MSRSTVIITTAVLIILVPFLGFPRGWQPFIFLVLGGIIIAVEFYAVVVRAQHAFFRDYEVNTEVYSERAHGKTNSSASEIEIEEKEDVLEGEDASSGEVKER